MRDLLTTTLSLERFQNRDPLVWNFDSGRRGALPQFQDVGDRQKQGRTMPCQILKEYSNLQVQQFLDH